MSLVCGDCPKKYSEKLEIFLQRVEDFCEQNKLEDEKITS